ncbi:MAG: hypothetical protein ABJG88_10620 [Litorimonas sp.]
MKFIQTFLLGVFILPFMTLCANGADADLTDTEKAMVFFVLSQTSEVRIHQMRGAKENTTYLHRDGHKEAVYDGAGKLVQDGMNDGSYNYAHPQKNPFEHYTKDIHPWIAYGTSPDDPTDIEERVYAYVLDLEMGIVSARKFWPEISVDDLIYAQSREKLPTAWDEVFKSSEAKKIFGLVNGEITMTNDTFIPTLKAIHVALDDVY